MAPELAAAVPKVRLRRVQRRVVVALPSRLLHIFVKAALLAAPVPSGQGAIDLRFRRSISKSFGISRYYSSITTSETRLVPPLQVRRLDQVQSRLHLAESIFHVLPERVKYFELIALLLDRIS